MGGRPADFADSGEHTLTERAVGAELAERFHGIEALPVQIYRGRSLWAKPGDKFQEALIYDGPPLVELWFPQRIEPDDGLSNLIVRGRCMECGRFQFTVKGVEYSPGDPPNRFESGFSRHRIEYEGIRVLATDLGDSMAFRYGAGRPLVLEAVKEYIEARGFTNVSFVDYGETI